jgi:acyl carrier protein
MGMDFEEITMEIEEEFNISISEEDYQALERNRDIVVGDIFELVLHKLHLSDFARYDVGLNRSLWREIQATVHHATGVPLDQIELKTPLKTLFPKNTRRRTWTALRGASAYRIKELDYPRAVRNVGLSMAAVVILFEQFQIWQFPALRWFWPLLGIFGIWMFFETYAKLLAVLGRFRINFPVGMTTVKDICRAVVAANYAELCRDAQVEAEPCQDVETELDGRSAEVWQKLTAIIADTVGVDAKEVTFSSRLVRDLGMC